MPISPEQKARTKSRILSHARAQVRRRGLEGATVERVMHGAGLTVGGFYGHFSDKNALLAETVAAGVAESRERLLGGLDGLRGDRFVAAIARRYLSREQRDDDERGCMLPRTLGEVARAKTSVRRALENELDLGFMRVAARLDRTDTRKARRRAIATLATCVGGMALARAVDDPKLSDEILRACRAALGAEEE